MKNLKIRSKILATFGIVLLLTAIIGVASIASASILGSTAENYVEISIPATNNLLHARRTIRHFQVSILESTAVEVIAPAIRSCEPLSAPKIIITLMTTPLTAAQNLRLDNFLFQSIFIVISSLNFFDVFASKANPACAGFELTP